MHRGTGGSPVPLCIVCLPFSLSHLESSLFIQQNIILVTVDVIVMSGVTERILVVTVLSSFVIFPGSVCLLLCCWRGMT